MARKGKKSQKIKKQLISDILHVFKDNPKKAYNYKQISRHLGITNDVEKVLVDQLMFTLASKEEIEETEGGKYKLKSKLGYITGKLELTQHGSGFVITDDLDQDVFIARPNLNHALSGDKVKVFLFAQSKRRGKIEGEIVDIISPINKTYVATLEMSEQYAFAIVDDRSMPYDIFIPRSKLNGAKDGQLVGVKVTEWPKRAKNPFGSVNLVFGDRGDNEAEIHAILTEFELPYKFPEKVLKAAEDMSDGITPEEIAKRRDMRDITTFTIDPADAKDFDDALSIRKLNSGNWEVGIHIADVSFYVQPHSTLDNEAYNRATSVYLVDRTVPMLPERLSNGICSLRPDEEKLCYSAVFEMDENANVITEWFGRTIIKSDRRFAYEEAQMVIDSEDGDLKDEILLLDSIAKKLRAERYSKGAIAFDRVEVKFNLGEKGEPLSVYFKESKDANKLIEEFMLLANRKVAAFISKQHKTFVYRIHDKPDPEKLSNFAQFVKKLGYKIEMTNDRMASKSINDLLDKIKGQKVSEVIETLAVRAMAKASYSTKNIGHYGLAFDDYTHFTSPIRRYPDVMVHRLLDRYLHGQNSAKEESYEDKCKHSSKMEQIASNAERASIKYKQVEFMQEKVGEEYEGLISGVTEWGIYVEIIENRCEGLVSTRSMEDDIYVFDEKNYCIRGKHTKQTYRIGDKVIIKILSTNLAKKQMDFALVLENEDDE